MVLTRSPICQIIRIHRGPSVSRLRISHPVRHVVRKYSTAAGNATPQTSQYSSLSMFAAVTGELDKIAPRFEVRGEQIRVLRGPAEFYEVLKDKISKAQRRVYLSTLYIGKSEHELIATIHDALKRNPDLKISVLTDALRGTRETPQPSCASLLATLVADFGPDRVEIRMFHTPNLTGLRKRWIPRRVNEGWGLQHMKLYGVDDEVMLSGANLSTDYFTNRQDRYHLITSKGVTNYYRRIHNATCTISYLVEPAPSSPGGYTLSWPSTNRCPSPLSDTGAFKDAAMKRLAPLIQPFSTPHRTGSNADTIIYPVFQFTPLVNSRGSSSDPSTELPALTSLLKLLPTPRFRSSSWTFTAGYFNMTPHIRSLLLSSNPAHGTVIAASPWANGFYGSKGVSGMLPSAYTLLERRFLDRVWRAGLGNVITLKEWRRGTVGQEGGWTYHAKGLWVTFPQNTSRTATEGDGAAEAETRSVEGPSVTLVGSSNYTKRSYTLDLEANAMIVTRNPTLRKRLKEEEEWLGEYAKPVDKDEFIKTERRVGLHVRIAMWIVTMLGGAL